MFGDKINNTRIFPVTIKIVITFTLFMLISNFTTNYINLVYNRSQHFKLLNELLTKDLKNIYQYCNNQYEIYKFDSNLEGSIESIEKRGKHSLKSEKGVIIGVQPNGNVLFQSSKISKNELFPDTFSLEKWTADLAKNVDEGQADFTFNDETYFGMYKYNEKWDAFVVRAEELSEFRGPSRKIFLVVGIIICAITLLAAFVGNRSLRFILRYINTMSTAIRNMIKNQQLGIIPLDGASNDDITYLGTAFNSLSNTVGNLVSIFQKFASKDVVQKAYQDLEVKLEGEKRELAILFSDIKSFTFITETLGTDIIKLLNMHYDRAIREVVKHDGVIGSIIGDAILAVFGTLEDATGNKSYNAVIAGYELHKVTRILRGRMKDIKDKMQGQKGGLTKAEARVYKAVLLEIGVGIDGGEVFYGTLGSYVQMTSTVIGDNVNAASRLEGLTRVYKTPVICSEYIKKDIEDNVEDHGISFLEIDTVMVKGKTKGVKIYWPILEDSVDDRMIKQIAYYEAGLKLFYSGDWKLAHENFKNCKLPPAEELRSRTKEKAPKDWKGIWEMTTK